MRIRVYALEYALMFVIVTVSSVIFALKEHSLFPVLFYSPVMVFMIFIIIREWKNCLIFDTDTEEIFLEQQWIPVDKILEVHEAYYPKGNSRLYFVLPDRTVIRDVPKFAYNMKYLRIFLQAHDITIQEEYSKWH